MAEGAWRSGYEHRGDEEDKRGHEQPERDIVHARERHVGRADHDRHHPVAEAADQRRHEHEEDHDEAVRADDDIVGHRVAEYLQSGLLELHPDQHRKRGAEDPSQDREQQIERSDILVVGRPQPPDEKPGLMVVERCCWIRHGALLPFIQACRMVAAMGDIQPSSRSGNQALSASCFSRP